MKHMTLREITQACKGTYFGSEESMGKEVSSVVIDSRKVEKDSLFVAIRGARVDGHTFIPKTIEDGALCALSEEDLGDVSYPYIRVESCTQALKDLAEHYRKKSGYQSSRNFRKCRKKQVQKEMIDLRTGAEVQRAENGGKF